MDKIERLGMLANGIPNLEKQLTNPIYTKEQVEDMEHTIEILHQECRSLIKDLGLDLDLDE